MSSLSCTVYHVHFNHVQFTMYSWFGLRVLARKTRDAHTPKCFCLQFSGRILFARYVYYLIVQRKIFFGLYLGRSLWVVGTMACWWKFGHSSRCGGFPIALSWRHYGMVKVQWGTKYPSHWENRCLTFGVSMASYGLRLVGNLSLHRAGKPGAFPPLSPRWGDPTMWYTVSGTTCRQDL